MPRYLLALAALAIAALSTFPRRPAATAGLAAIRVPDGFEVLRAAGADLTSYPMMGTVDDRGRLFLCESSGHTLTTPQMSARPDYRIRLLEDTDGDGLYDRSKVFADRLTLPAGAVWLKGSLYVAAPPDLLRFDDLNHDGIADRREVVVTGWNLSANAASLHGPFLGPDGWLYLTDGRHGFKIRTKEGTVLEGRASGIWRSRPDGAGLERMASGGFDNPVEVVFTPAGEVIGTMTYFQDPKDGQRDALLHFVEGGAYPKWHPYASELKFTGELMPVMTKFARVAPSGLLRLERPSLGPDYQGNLFSAHFNSHRVLRHKLFRDGATFRTEDCDFLVSSDPDFHPTDVIEDRDGSILVVDTGAWFIHGCPISRFSKPQIRGGIYRVRRVGQDSRPVPALVHRAATIFSAPPETVRTALADPDLEVRIAAARVAGMNRDRAALPRLLEMVRKDEPPVRRQAAAAIGQIGDKSAVPALAAAAAGVTDRFLEHAIIFSLIQLADPSATSLALRAASPEVRKAALIALDQMDRSPLRAPDLLPHLTSPSPDLRRAALWVASHHPDWASSIVPVLRADQSEAVRDLLVALLNNPAVQSVVAEQLASVPARRAFLLDVIDQSSLKKIPTSWVEPLGLVLDDPNLRLRALHLIRSRAVAGLDDRLARVTSPDDHRLAALAALVQRRPQLSSDSFDFLLRWLAPELDAVFRQSAAQTLAQAVLTPDQLLTLSRRPFDPLILPTLVEAFRHAADEPVGLALVELLRRSPAAAFSLGADRVRALLRRFPPPVQAAARPVLARFDLQQRERLERLRRLEPLLTAGGDSARGRQIFFGPKVACSSCHTIGNQGGHVGPDLTAVGAIRSGHDLLEAIVFPSASFVPGHEIYRVETATDVFSGVLLSRSEQVVILVTGPNGEVHIPREQVRSMARSPVSLMPEGFDEVLSAQEFADLLAYLRAQTSRETAQL
jgi:putative membrane-bound dehydrogenase-like protein